MIGFVARWLSGAFGMAAAIPCGVLLMQAPAATQQYAASLLQVAEAQRSDIDRREESARQYYAITATADAPLVAALKPFEPSNAETLAQAIDKVRRLRDSYQRIMQSGPLLAPIAAFRDALDDAMGDKQPIWRGVLKSYDPQLSLTAAGAIYGLAGLVLGSLLAQALLSLVGAAFGRLRRA